MDKNSCLFREWWVFPYHLVWFQFSTFDCYFPYSAYRFCEERLNYLKFHLYPIDFHKKIYLNIVLITRLVITHSTQYHTTKWICIQTMLYSEVDVLFLSKMYLKRNKINRSIQIKLSETSNWITHPDNVIQAHILIIACARSGKIN